VVEIDQISGGPALAVCNDGLARVAYRKNAAVYLATEGDPFVIELVDDAHTADGQVGLTCAADGSLHVLFDSSDGLLHATDATADGWTIEVVSVTHEFADAVADPDGQPYVAAGSAELDSLDLFHLTATGWESDTLAGPIYRYQAALWSDSEDVMVCFFGLEDRLECWSTAPVVGEPGTDDDTVDDDTSVDDDTYIDDDTGVDDDAVDDDVTDDDVDDDTGVDDDTVDDDVTDDDVTDDDADDDSDDDADDDADDDVDDDSDDDADDDIGDDNDDDIDDDADDDGVDDDQSPADDDDDDDNDDDNGGGCFR